MTDRGRMLELSVAGTALVMVALFGDDAETRAARYAEQTKEAGWRDVVDVLREARERREALERPGA